MRPLPMLRNSVVSLWVDATCVGRGRFSDDNVHAVNTTAGVPTRDLADAMALVTGGGFLPAEEKGSQHAQPSPRVHGRAVAPFR
jgi:hypothetical protein